jgi:hypothetical protein
MKLTLIDYNYAIIRLNVLIKKNKRKMKEN